MSAAVADARAWSAIAAAGGRYTSWIGAGLDSYNSFSLLYSGHTLDGIMEGVSAISLATALEVPQSLPATGPTYLMAKFHKKIAYQNILQTRLNPNWSGGF